MTDRHVIVEQESREVGGRGNARFKTDLKCSCGKRFSGSGKYKITSVTSAEKRFRDHIPIR